MSDTVLLNVEDSIATITLNRPESLNSMSAELLDTLGQVGKQVAEDDDVRAVILTGAGRAFCAGGDIRSMRDRGERAADESTLAAAFGPLRAQEEISVYLAEMPKPTIAAINGAAAGAGMSLALACDFRIMGEAARIVPAFAKIGFSGDFGGTWFLQRLVGPSRAREIYFLSEPISAEQALAEGIVTRVVPHEQVMVEAMALATRLANGPTLAYGRIKRNFTVGATGTLSDALDSEAEGMTALRNTEDHKSAALAFLSKQEPVFTGR
jgi:2-(1,2-epoxy-1,2-dihydrophenyl)acetyl-CoA isomerase